MFSNSIVTFNGWYSHCFNNCLCHCPSNHLYLKNTNIKPKPYMFFLIFSKRHIILYIYVSLSAPVSSVQLVSECLSLGQMKVSCLFKGDSPQYSWTLDGHTLTDSDLLSGNNETNIIILRQNISGRLVCSVRSQISNSFNQMNIPGCGE